MDNRLWHCPLPEQYQYSTCKTLMYIHTCHQNEQNYPDMNNYWCFCTCVMEHAHHFTVGLKYEQQILKCYGRVGDFWKACNSKLALKARWPPSLHDLFAKQFLIWVGLYLIGCNEKEVERKYGVFNGLFNNISIVQLMSFWNKLSVIIFESVLNSIWHPTWLFLCLTAVSFLHH